MPRRKTVLTLVVSNAGSLQNGILALLTTIPQISPVLADEELGTALRLVENHRPALAILDVAMPEVKEIIRQIKEACPQTSLIVLVNNVREQKDVEELGVDGVLLKGFPAQKLIDIVERLTITRETLL
jgi:DNA-binding NarL/FixJ family response regulator